MRIHSSISLVALVILSLSGNAAASGPEQAPHPRSVANLSQGVQLENVGQLGGAVRAVAAQGTYVYIGMGQRLAVLDISSPTTPRMVGQTEDLGQVTAVAVAGNYAYAVRGDDIFPRPRPGWEATTFHRRPSSTTSPRMEALSTWLPASWVCE
jgi:hypothetical protein